MCEHCDKSGNIIDNSGVPVEKHIPEVCVNGCKDTVTENEPEDEMVCSAEFPKGCI